MDAEAFGGIAWAVDPPTARGQDGLDVRALDGVQVFRSGRGCRPPEPERIVELQGLAR